MRWAELPACFPEFPGPERWLPLLEQHSRLVETHGDRVGLTAVPAALAVRRNYAESLEAWRLTLASGNAAAVADVGPGAGFPGLVVAAVAPAVRVTLVEPLRKRAAFLELAAAELGLGNVTVVAARAEEAGRGPLRETCDVVLARAVAPLRELLEYTVPLVAVGGRAALPKGSRAPEEVEEATAAAAALGVELAGMVAMRPEVSHTPWMVLYRKLIPTPERFPRRPGVPGRRPL